MPQCQTWQTDGKQQGPVSPVQGWACGRKCKEKMVRMDDVRPSVYIKTRCHFLRGWIHSLPLFPQIQSLKHSTQTTVLLPPLSLTFYAIKSHSVSCIIVFVLTFLNSRILYCSTDVFSHSFSLHPFCALPQICLSISVCLRFTFVLHLHCTVVNDAVLIRDVTVPTIFSSVCFKQ